MLVFFLHEEHLCPHLGLYLRGGVPPLSLGDVHLRRPHRVEDGKLGVERFEKLAVGLLLAAEALVGGVGVGGGIGSGVGVG